MKNRNSLSNWMKKGASSEGQAWSKREKREGCKKEDGAWSQNGRMLEEAAIEHPFSTLSAPFGTTRKEGGNQCSSSMRSWTRLAAMLTLLLTLGVGQMWAYTNVYLNGDFTGGNWNQTTWQFTWWYGASDGKYYIPVYASGSAQYWRLYTNNCVSPYTNNYVLSVGDAAYGTGYNGEKNFKYTGNAGIIKVCIDQTSSEWSPSVWLERPTIKIKHPWNGGSWTEQDATDNNDGTYSYKGKYGGTAGFNAGISGDLKYKEASTTVTGSPASGDYCMFTWNASGYQYGTGEGNNTGTFTITKLCTITYNANGATSGTKPADQTDILYNTSTTVRGNTGTLAKTGYTFAGWNTKSDGTGTTYAAGTGTIKPTAVTTTLYAKWTANTYDGTIDKNGGAADQSYTATYNSSSLTIATAPTRTGYNLSGYYEEAECTHLIANTSKALQASTSYTNSSSKWNYTSSAPTLYAGWTAKTTTVTLNGNAPGGQTVTGGGTTVTATYDAALPSFSALSCTGGYALKGYYTLTSGGTKVINSDGSYASNGGVWDRTDGATLTLHAQWSLDRTLTYSGNGNTSGDVPAEPAVYANGASATVLGNTGSLAKTGYSFNNWNTEAGGGGTDYSAGNTITMNANYTLYAQWTEKNYTVTVNAGSNGSVASGSVTGHIDTKVTLPTATANTGYHFSTWTTTSGSVTYTNQTSATEAQVNGMTAAATVRADFAANTYSVVFNANGGTGSMSNQSFTYNAAAKALTSNSFTRSGYTFLGWATTAEKANALTVDYTNGQSVRNLTSTNGGTFNLYAVWAKKYYIGGRFQHDWEEGSATTNEMAYDGTTGYYKFESNKTVSELSVQWHNTSGDYDADQYFYIHTGLGKGASSSQPTYVGASSNGHTMQVKIGYSNAYVLTAKTSSFSSFTDEMLLKFSNTDNLSSNVIVWWDPANRKVWYTATESLNTNYYLLGFAAGSWGETDARRFKVATVNATTATVSVSLSAKTYTQNTDNGFKVENGGTYYGNNGTMTRANCTSWPFETDKQNCGITADLAGTYTFTLNLSTKAVSVTYPTAYQLNYDIGTVKGTSGSISTDPSTASGSYVGSGNSVTLTGPAAKTGYAWKGWYTNAAGTEGNIPDVSRAITVTMNADKTLYACYTETMHTVTVAAGDGGTRSPATVSAGIATKSGEATATANKGYVFTSWTLPSGTSAAEGYTSSSNPIKINATADSKTITANFAAATAFIEGRFHVTNASRNGTWTNTFSGGDWDEGSTSIKFTWDGTNERFYLHTYATPKELTTQISSLDPYFYIKTSSSSSSLANVVSYWSATSQTLSAAGTGNKRALTHTGTFYNNRLKFSSSTTSGYAVIYFDESNIWYELEQRLQYNGNGNTGGSAPTGTYGNNTYHANGGSITAPANTYSKTGYNFTGWKVNNEGALITAGSSVTMNADKTLYAQWTKKTTTITYSQSGTGYGSGGQSTTKTATYGEAMPTPIETPTAANGYAFMGYYDALAPLGTKYYNADGTSARTWNKEDAAVTLYAYFKKAEITGITFSPGAVVENEQTVTVTATISPTPTGTTTVCWRVLYDNGSALDPQPTFTPESGATVSFIAPSASGMYKVEAKLRTGSSCGGGTLLDTEEADFQVAGSHIVTVAYKSGGTSIQASTKVNARPLVWSDPIDAPDIFGYTFDHWTAGDGITLSADGSSAIVGEESSANPIYIQATYNGTLTANYTQKSLIYFYNTLGWSSVYVNFYGADGYWDDKGSGNKSVTNRNKAMTRIGDSDVWYYDYGAASITPTKWVSFTRDVQNGDGSGAQNFWAADPGEPVSYPARRADDLADKATETGFYSATPMFVPTASQTPVTKNSSGGGRALYYNSGYWTKYLPGTGYTLEIYNSAGNSKLKEMDFTSTDELMPMHAIADLEANTTYKFQIKRHGDVYLGNSGTMTYSDHGQGTPWEMTNSGFAMCGITTTAAGDYTFNLTYSANASDQYRIRLAVDYPVASGDYRLVYKDDVHTNIHPSAIVNKVNNSTAIVSFFVRHDENPDLRIQQATVNGSGAITWKEYPTDGTPTNQITGAIASAITKDTVYNFNLSMNGSGALSVTSAEYYSGNYYIRTDAANSKWDNYRSDPDHLISYSDYLKKDVGYSHYYTHWVNKDDVGRKNVKFVIANDYSPCISDTLAREEASGIWAHIGDWMEAGGDLKRSANVRFMWDIETNAVARAYIDGAQESGTHFLEMLSSDSKIKNSAGTETLTAVTFSDNGNWIYEANVQAQANALYKLKSTWGEGGNAILQYFKGSSSETETLIGGSNEDENWYPIRVIYDFKTNRIVASYVPATGTISEEIPINADVMFIREHQGDIAQLTFSGSGAISEIKTAYGVMRFNKWTINNKSKATGHAPLSPELTRYERDLFYISFPFEVSLEEVFGFGTYGTHWIIEEYDGAGRAEKGFWIDSPTFWKFITNRKGKFLKPNVGYILALDLDELGEGSSVWSNTDNVELYFPSYGDMPNITSSSVTHTLPEHECTINRGTEQGDRRIKDSHWNIMSVPTYINTSNVSFANTTWITAGDGRLGPKFLYTWNTNDNTLSATSGIGFTYKAMHAYTVQYYGNVTWTTSVSPSSIVAHRTYAEAPSEVEFCLELQQNENMIDRTFVRMSNDADVDAEFVFGEDMSKDFYKNKANIYTKVTTLMDDELTVTEVAGNCLPMSEQTTVVPMGIMTVQAGTYTISIPSGTSGVGVTLIDNETGIRTNLALMDYTVDLDAATYDDRFVLEISPMKHLTTDIEGVDDAQDEKIRKVLIDQKMYIIKDKTVFDARGARVK